MIKSTVVRVTSLQYWITDNSAQKLWNLYKQRNCLHVLENKTRYLLVSYCKIAGSAIMCRDLDSALESFYVHKLKITAQWSQSARYLIVWTIYVFRLQGKARAQMVSLYSAGRCTISSGVPCAQWQIEKGRGLQLANVPNSYWILIKMWRPVVTYQTVNKFECCRGTARHFLYENLCNCRLCDGWCLLCEILTPFCQSGGHYRLIQLFIVCRCSFSTWYLLFLWLNWFLTMMAFVTDSLCT